MRVLVAPDKFAGTLTAVEAAEAIAEGWRRHAPDDELDLAPMADGGPGFVDVVRPHAPGPGVYTYWDYQRLAFPKKRGMRIDFVLGSPAFAARVAGAVIDREERKGVGASDHAPVVVELDD